MYDPYIYNALLDIWPRSLCMMQISIILYPWHDAIKVSMMHLSMILVCRKHVCMMHVSLMHEHMIHVLTHMMQICMMYVCMMHVCMLCVWPIYLRCSTLILNPWPRFLYLWCIYLVSWTLHMLHVYMMHISMMHVYVTLMHERMMHVSIRLSLDPDVCMYVWCIHIYDPWPWYMHVWCMDAWCMYPQ